MWGQKMFERYQVSWVHPCEKTEIKNSINKDDWRPKKKVRDQEISLLSWRLRVSFRSQSTFLKTSSGQAGVCVHSKGESCLWAVFPSFHWPGFPAPPLLSQHHGVLSVCHQPLPRHRIWRDSLLPRKTSAVSSITDSPHTKRTGLAATWC